MKAVILSGGLGSRMGDLTNDIPKPLLKIGGKPVLEHQIDNLKRYGITDIIIATGYLSEKIEDYFGDGAEFGVSINYSVEDTPLGSAGCLNLIKKHLTEDFLVVNADVMFDVDFDLLIEFHKSKNAYATLVVHPNDHPFDSDLLEINKDFLVTEFHPKPRGDGWYQNLVNAGMYVFNPKLFEYIPSDAKSDIGRDVLPKMFKAKEKLYGYNTAEYLKDMGTPLRFEKVNKDYESGLITSCNLENPRPCIFLDRDGVINPEKNLLYKIQDFELFPWSIEAIKKINSMGYLAVVVTNQPIIARNLSDIKNLEEIHKKMETLLGEGGAKLDAIYFCPHHPDKGYPEENPDYKIECHCRKPDTGMIELAQERFNIDMSKSMIIGDSTRDIQCGKNAGIKTILVKTGFAGEDGVIDVKSDLVYENLLDAVNQLLD